MKHPSISSIVRKYLLSQVEAQGNNVWLLKMSYAECNDYAETTRQILQAKHGTYFRFETIARRIREFKNSARSTEQGVS